MKSKIHHSLLQRVVLLSHGIASLLALYAFTACERSSNSLDEIKLECGPDLLETDFGRPILKFSAPGSVKEFDSRSLTVVALGATHSSSPFVSSRGCVTIPEGTQAIRAKTSINGKLQGAVVDPKTIAVRGYQSEYPL